MKSIIKKISAAAMAAVLLGTGSVLTQKATLTAHAAGCPRCGTADAYMSTGTVSTFADGYIVRVHCNRCQYTAYNYYRW